MKELLPVVIGILVGTGATLGATTAARGAILVVGGLVGGACASAINGELEGSRWALFVSFDTLIVGVCAVLTLILALRLLEAQRPGRSRT